MKYSICFFMLFIIGNTLVFGSDEPENEKKKIRSIVYFQLGGAIATTSYQFLEVYRNELGGRQFFLKNFPVLGAGSKFEITRDFRLGISMEYFRSFLNDTYEQEVISADYTGHRRIVDNMTVINQSLVFSLEYIPYIDWQFKTYIGAGAGFSFGSIKWHQDIASNIHNDYRFTGEYYNEGRYAPTLRLIGGLELGFDKDYDDSLLGSLITEIRLNFLLNKTNIFKEFDKIFPYEVKDFKNKYYVQAFYVSFNIIISMNFIHSIIKN